MSNGRHEVEDLRAEMERIDGKLVELLDARAKAAKRIAEVRAGQPPVLPAAERASLRKMASRSGAVMPEESLREILREVNAACLAIELPVKVSYAGTEGGPCHVVGRRRFGSWSQLSPAESVAAAFDEVARRRAEYAVVPFETSSEGPVHTTIAALVASELKVIEVADLSLELHLMNRSGSAGDIEKVYATAADRADCQKGLASAGLRATTLDVRSPLFACQLTSEDPSTAALAMEAVGAPLGLQVAQRNVVDKVGERTRFALVGPRPSSRTGEDFTSVAFSVPDAPGALLDVLKQFAERGVNLTKVHSRPIQGDGWNYLFLVEIVGHATDRPVVTAVEEVKRLTKFLKVLGSYPMP